MKSLWKSLDRPLGSGNQVLLLSFERFDPSEAKTLVAFKALFVPIGDKAPYPKSFQIEILVVFLGIYQGLAYLAMIMEFHEHNKFVTSLNAMFVVLILKNRLVNNLKDFRLISLSGGRWVCKFGKKKSWQIKNQKGRKVVET